MTTLIIHPKIEVQEEKAIEIIQGFLQLSGTFFHLNEIHHPDLHLVDGTIVSSIGIEDIKEFMHSLQYQPYQAEKQIGVIFFSDALTTEAQNALLKTLEEPGLQTEYILTVSHEKKILPTILSRTNIINVDKVLNREYQKNEFNLNDFLKLGLPAKFIKLEELVDDNKKEKKIVENFLIQLTQYYRERLVYAVRNKQKNNIYRTSKDLKEISKAIHYISRNTNKRLTLENLILQLEHRK